MMKSVFGKLMLSLILAFSVSFVACSKKQQVKPGESPTVTDADIESGRADSDSGSAMGLQTVYFPYDSAQITSGMRNILAENEKILKANGNVKVQIEGHCDERGGIQYNLALGERRANSVKQYLSSRGIPASRMTVISFGKERPIDTGSDEDAWSKNRRGNFVITEK